MLGLGTEDTYYFHITPVDMRKGFNGLSSLANDHVEQEQVKNVVYAFINKQKKKLKLLHWRAGGFVLYYKRLKKGVFELPKYDIKSGLIVLSYAEKVMVLDGISRINTTKNKRYLSNK
jgi:transposase|tara:strand:- start:965 stop:1318 length:354 start_codon:yes stop_codon:yes gene_type:complete